MTNQVSSFTVSREFEKTIPTESKHVAGLIFKYNKGSKCFYRIRGGSNFPWIGVYFSDLSTPENPIFHFDMITITKGTDGKPFADHQIVTDIQARHVRGTIEALTGVLLSLDPPVQTPAELPAGVNEVPAEIDPDNPDIGYTDLSLDTCKRADPGYMDPDNYLERTPDISDEHRDDIRTEDLTGETVTDKA